MTLATSVNQGRQLPLATAYVRVFYMGVTGLTLTVTISKAGAAFGAAAGAVAEISSGWYKVSLTTVDTGTQGDLAFHATDGGVNVEDWSDQVAAVTQVDPAQAIATSNTANTVGDCLNAARAQGFGKWAITGTTLRLYAADGTTVVRTFTLDSATSPLART